MEYEDLIEQIEGATNFGLGTMKPKILSAFEQLMDERDAAEKHEEYLRGEIDKLENEIDILTDFRNDVDSAMKDMRHRLEDY